MFIMLADAQSISKVIQIAKSYNAQAYFVILSTVIPEELLSHLCVNNKLLCDEYTKNIFLTQVTPNPNNIKVPIVTAFRNDLKKYLQSEYFNQIKDGYNYTPSDIEMLYNHATLEGYINAVILIKALHNIENIRYVDRSILLEAINNLNYFDIGLSHDLYLSSINHTASTKIYKRSFTMGEIIDLEIIDLNIIKLLGNSFDIDSFIDT